MKHNAQDAQFYTTRMKFTTTSITLYLAYISRSADAACNVDDHHPENDGFFFVGAAGESNLTNLDSAHGQKLQNSTWASGMYYPHGEFTVCNAETDRGCRAPCDAEPGCQQSMSSHTCSILQFCPPTDVTTPEEVYLLNDQAALDACDFTDAKVIGIMNSPTTTDGNTCVEYPFEEDHELKDYHFSSKQGCDAGQKLAVTIQDFGMTADQCIAIGLTTSRVRNCDCRLQKKPSTLGEPCRTAFSDSCQESVIETDECCAAGNCITIYEDYGHPEGKKKEDDRRAACDDSMPGLCYNADGMGSDVDGKGSKDCCKKTCSECGTVTTPRAIYNVCDALFAETSTAKCGRLGRYDPEPYECDFSLCEEGDHWHPDGEAFQAAFGTTGGDGSGAGDRAAGAAAAFVGAAITFVASM
mmetsp:Transcript_24735/g.44577  ORF Transcript_24735/g.44577 Transcript_24735/m.44577 type:complete len:412 (-) Transcript_24735:255-1490(-)